MRRLPLVLLLLLCATPATGRAEEEQPARPKHAEQVAADAVLAAFKSGSDATLAELAKKRSPESWVVAEVLRQDGHLDAAKAFAAASPEHPDLASLGTYLEGEFDAAADKADRALFLELTEHFRTRDITAVLTKTAKLNLKPTTVTGVQLVHMRSVVLQVIREPKACTTTASAGADAALAIGWRSRGSALLQMAAINAYRSSQTRLALSIWTQQHKLETTRGLAPQAAGALANMGIAQERLGMFDEALASHRSAAAQFDALGDKLHAAHSHSNIGNVHQARGELNEAIAAHEQTLERYKALNNKGGAARTLGNIANIHYMRGDYPQALATQEQALKDQKEVGDQAAVARTLGNIGLIQAELGNFTKALATYERSQEMKEKLGDRAGVAGTLVNMGSAHAALGEYAKALAVLERAYKIAKEVGHRQWAAHALGNMGSMFHDLGDQDRALATYKRSLAEFQELGDKVGIAQAHDNLGTAYMQHGDHAEGLSHFEKSLIQAEEIGDKPRIASALSHMASAQFTIGREEEALGVYARAVALWMELGNRADEARVREQLGTALLKRGDFEAARQEFDKSRRTARSLRITPLYVRALVSLARLYLIQDEAGRGLGYAREALNAMEGLLGGLGEEEGATARSRHTDLFAIGTLAAVREEDLAEALTFMESGRAGALLDTLGKREQLRWKAETLPEELLKAEREAQALERARRMDYDRVVKTGKRKAVRDASDALDIASESVRAVAARIQRALKERANLYYPRAKPIEDIRAVLEEDQAFVLYGLCLDEALALVLRRDSERVALLGRTAEVQTAIESLEISAKSPDAATELAALRALLVEPLKLGDEVRQILVSPDASLCYLPFGALFKQPVAMTPSGTTHSLLLEMERGIGKGILAIGDPDYAGAADGVRGTTVRGRPLSALPATRAEVNAIGTKALLGADANEARLRELLPATETWRAVHFACHGLVRPKRPMRSFLALSNTGDDDGLLTMQELLRMQIPADLAVLSACETARGKNVHGEGIVGLTRAFMFAGSPRVICSLWKVDDEATQALMIKFYELWNPKEGEGLGAAEALQKAQAFVRSQEKWKAPYYWAAWVLWGLPN